jgi:hypothetical protein
MDFIEYYQKLAPEGETALIVRQKPQLKAGELQFHADGAIKCTWPAYLPSHNIKPDWAIYGNTASFIIDRFDNGHVSASAANCEYVLVMVLDDVGDPEKAPNTPSVPPTWVIETSEGSYQWGYTFSEQPTKGEYAAAIRAVADAGYTDPGACNAVRNFRLPGSINLKPNKNRFAARLVEFHPEREYTLAELCAGLNVTPAPADSLTLRPIRLSDDGADDVMAWLSGQGLLLGLPKRNGWADIICPNKAEHTDGNPEAGYNPAMRAFRCLHSHCIDLDSHTFLDWVAAQGGPKHAPGLRDELLAAVMDQTLAKLQPTEAFPDKGAEVIAEVEKKQLDRVTKEDWYSRFAYILNEDSFFDMEMRYEIDRTGFNALYRHVLCYSIHKTGKNSRRVEASVCYDENRHAKNALTLAGITYAAGESVLVSREGQVYGNRWVNRRPAIPTSTCSPQRWFDHLEKLIPTDFEREHVLNVMAYKLQNANKKINHAVLHIGRPGSGKDTLWEPLLWGVGGANKANVKTLKNEEITSQWGYSLESEIMVFEELRESEARDRRALENHLKPIIAAPPEFLQVNRKRLHPYDILNRVFVLAFSNERAPLSLPSDDRRWFVTYSDAPRMPDPEGKAFWDWYASGGLEAVCKALYARDVSQFNPGAAPPLTEAKIIMIEQGRSTAESYLVEMIERRLGEFSAGVVASPFYSLCDRLQGGAPMGTRVVQQALLHALKEAGWVDMGRLMSREFSTRKHVFAAPDLADTVSKSELRRMVEETPPPAAVRLVK